VVEVSKTVEAELRDPSRAQLATRLAGLPLDAVDEERELPRIDIPLVGGAVEAGEELVAIEGLAAAVALDHLERLRDRAFVGGEAVTAGAAFAAPADSAIGDPPGLEGPRRGVAPGTVHSSESTVR
jgi:hypothetical protein